MESMAERNDQLKRVLSLTQEEKDDDLLHELEKSFLRCQDLEDTLKHVQLESKEASNVWNQEKKCLVDQLQDLQLSPKELREESAFEIQELRETSCKLEKENTDLFKSLGRCQTECKEAKSRADEMHAATVELQEEIGKLQNERKELNEILQNSSRKQENLTKLQDESSKLEKEKSNLTKQLESRQLVCQQFEEYLAAATEESERHMELAMKLKAENEDLSRQLTKTQNQKESSSFQAVTPKTVKRTGQQVEELQNVKKGLEQKLSKAEDESSKATSKPAQSQCVIEDLTKKMDELEREREKLTERLQTADIESKDLTDKTEAALEKTREMEELKNEVELKNKKLEFDVTFTKNKVETAFSMVDDYKKDVADMKVHNRGLKNQVDFQKNKVQDLEGQVSKLKEQSASLEKKLEDAEQRVKYTEDLKDKEMDYLKEKGMNDLKEKETEIKKVRYQLEAKTVKFDAMEKEKNNLQGKVSEMRKLKEVLEVKVAKAETREKGVEDEMEGISCQNPRPGALMG
ncbi:tropomyosin-2-like [Lytechinus pictus]|uniref:tropomyosin-2-like n=1 Tax=Lytechinus pictus TaxID=7653 RepID=UPI0030B9E58A